MMKKRVAPSATTGVSKDHKGEVRIELPVIMRSEEHTSELQSH